ncbi:sensor histidine kinase [Solimicrobium silvestre]|uniref:Histidine kinase n=1 Tax=Solimicrobium silvestre TaxID=2099400 RepID=A0A2S9GV79_9BURK|nr:histidine kinase [Solimicrobium silvestre]PRC91635.1 Histidine kinase [Solimicrobium silvestre]
MNQPTLILVKEFIDSLISMLTRFFEKVTNWVTELSWMKFVLFAIVLMIMGAITQDQILSSDEKVIVTKKPHSASSKIFSDRDSDIEINNSGIHIRKNKNSIPPAPPAPPTISTTPADSVDSSNTTPSNSNAKEPIDDDEIHVKLPPGVSDDISKVINDEIADANEHEVESYRKKQSTWLMSLIMLSLFGLFGIKALMGGKRRAEILAQAAQEAAERESLRRQVVEAKMQMMQAQIEPHFLFNTLASVEHLIETDPPRASAMQRSLIQYLRAVIPQMRENSNGTNLGREAGIVQEYLTLLKMRMEERLEFSISIPEGLSSAAFPSMMLQTLVENAIKHGLEPKAEGGKVTISAEVAHNKLRVSVSDNGLGFGAVPSNGTGLGLQNIRERLALLYQGNYQFIITPNSPTGVAVTIEIPYQFTHH